MSLTYILLLVGALFSSMCICLCSLLMISWNDTPTPPTRPLAPSDPKSPSSPGSTPMGSGSWKRGYATWYNSYPACCKKSPIYDKKASKSECKDYSGCKYMGKFAGYKGTMPHSEVKKRNIVAFYDDAHQSGKGAMSWWRKNAKGKKIEIRHPSSGKTMVADVLDTCGNHDCNNCCSRNSKKGGGYLLDLEGYTAKRFWGSQKNGTLEWRWV